MSEQSKKSKPSVKTLLILGATGDLTARLLLPGLAKLVATGRAGDLNLVGSGREEWTQEHWRDRVKKAFEPAFKECKENGREALEKVIANASYRVADVTKEGELPGLLDGLPTPIAIYFALPPAVSLKAISLLKPGELPEGTRLVMEKPFGESAATAKELNDMLVKLVPEDHIHRVDHFLGKSTVFNILGLRFANRILEPMFSNENVAKVEIIFDEDLTLEGRASYYDGAGALRDMIQSHLLQIMAFIAMNPPATLGERDLRDHIGSVLRASKIAGDVEVSTRRARYTAGKIGDRSVPNYVDEEGVDPSKNTETLAEVQIAINNSRWAGVPFILRSGKALAKPRKEAIITFKPVAHLPEGFLGGDKPDRLRIGFGPATLRMEIDVNGPGNIFTLDRAILEANLHDSDLLPYGEVLDGVLSGDPLLSVRGDIAVDSWRIVDPVLEAWKTLDKVPMEEYPAGSFGPEDWETSREEDPIEDPQVQES